MKNVQFIGLEKLNTVELNRLKAKARNGYQFLRFPRAASTITDRMFKDILSPEMYVNLGCCSFSNLPFSWGIAHNDVIDFPYNVPPHHPEFQDTLIDFKDRNGYGEYKAFSNSSGTSQHSRTGGWSGFGRHWNSNQKSWIQTFNARADEKPGYNSNKLTIQVVRNPYDWLTSVYNWDFMQSRSELNIGSFSEYVTFLFSRDKVFWKQSPFLNSRCPGIDYKIPPDHPNYEWACCVRHPFPWPMTKRCFFQGFDDDDNCHVDVYIRYEYLREGLKQVLSLGGYNFLDHLFNDLSLDPELSRKKTGGGRLIRNHKVAGFFANETSNTDYEVYKHRYYTKELIDLVRNAYDWDLKNFNYDFEGSLDKLPVLINGSAS